MAVKVNGKEKQVIKKQCTECPVCGKRFFIPVDSNSIYKFKNLEGFTRTFCSWTCYNAGLAEKKNAFRRKW